MRIIISISLVLLEFFFSKFTRNSETLVGTMYGGEIVMGRLGEMDLGGHRGSDKTRGSAQE